MSKVGDTEGSPRAIVHKRILDVAASRPDASFADIADEITAATPSLVERVLEEYGDPAETENVEAMLENGQPAEHGESTTEETVPADGEEESDENRDEKPVVETPPEDADELTAKQRKTADIVHRHPEASQAKIADTLGVTRATVSRRLNEIPGFEWQNRATFTETLFGPREATTADSGERDERQTEADDQQTEADTATTASGSAERPEMTAALGAVEERLTALEATVQEAADTGEQPPAESVALPPELTHKVVHAAMESDQISEDEELQLLQALLS